MSKPDETPRCSTHPQAPHGFDRTSSHSLGRYVCECEGWSPRETDRLNEAAPELLRAAEAMLDMYAQANASGDWGYWDLEQDDEYVALRAAVRKARGQ